MKYAIIENGIVTNIALADAPLADNWIASEVACIGDKYEDGQFATPPLDTAPVAAAARARRNGLLAASDWTQGKDIPDSVSTAWATYRQQLRDVPAQAGFPLNIQWPTPPNA